MLPIKRIYFLLGVLCPVFLTSCHKQEPTRLDSASDPLVIVKIAKTELENDAHHRELGAHVHGAASLNLVLGDSGLTINMSIPGMDAVGFEHPVNTPDEEEKLKSVLAYLQKPNAIFLLPLDSECRMMSGTLETALLDKEAKTGSHADVDISYEWQCKSPDALKKIQVQLFSQFPHLQKIQANWVSQTRQGTAELTEASAILHLE